jgi:hypothetical protein
MPGEVRWLLFPRVLLKDRLRLPPLPYPLPLFLLTTSVKFLPLFKTGEAYPIVKTKKSDN